MKRILEQKINFTALIRHIEITHPMQEVDEEPGEDGGIYKKR